MNITIIETIAEHFDKITVTRGGETQIPGNGHLFFRKRESIYLFMIYYIEKMIALFNEYLDATVSSPEK